MKRKQLRPLEPVLEPVLVELSVLLRLLVFPA